jgi:transaldolase
MHMDKNPLRVLEAQGQSVWLDLLSRPMLKSGELGRLIADDGVTGVTANPAIFEKAIAGGHDYDDAIRELARRDQDPKRIYEALAVADVGQAADSLRPIYERTRGQDGFASLEVAPDLANDTEGTVTEARRLWQALGRPNAMIKVPGTRAGLEAIRRLTAEGVNINVTLLFGLERYHEVIDAFITGLEERAAQGRPINGIGSVASFFLSRIDVLVDPQLEEMMENTGSGLGRVAQDVYGETAIASAKIAYQIYRETFAGERYRALAGQGARPQRLLWASTGTKNPAFSDTKYVDALIGPETVNTMPLETLEAYRDHGQPVPGRTPLTEGVAHARDVLEDLSEVGIELEQVTEQLEVEGVQKFQTAFDKMLASISDVTKISHEIRENGEPEPTTHGERHA